MVMIILHEQLSYHSQSETYVKLICLILKISRFFMSNGMDFDLLNFDGIPVNILGDF